MAFIALGAQQRGASSRQSPAMNVELEPFGVTVAPSAAEIQEILSGPLGHDFVEFPVEDSEVVYINVSAILYFRD